MSALGGSPALLLDRAERHAHSAHALADAAAALRALLLESRATSIEAIEERAARAATELDEAHRRHAGTAFALVDFAIALQAAHDRIAAAEDRRRELDAPALDALAEIEAARRDVDEAAVLAIARIESVLSGASDPFAAPIDALVDEIGAWLGTLAARFEAVLDSAVARSRAIVDGVLAVLGFTTILVVLGSIGGALLGVVLGPLGPLLTAALVTLLATFVLVSVLSDVLARPPVVARWSPSGSDFVPRAGSRRLADALEESAEVDRLGGPDGAPERTVVKITRLVAEDGTVRWRAVLPSTREWATGILGHDDGATNDLDSNLALMLAPALPTQYERAVLDALRAAGATPDDPVMLVGFSQGGIVAGHLAAYNRDLAWDAIIVAGAPIDNMPIPPDVTVVSVQHLGDPVPALDTAIGGTGSPRERPNWTTITAPSVAPGDRIGSTHDARRYSETLRAHAPAIGGAFPDLLDFFPRSGTAQTVGYYAWAE